MLNLPPNNLLLSVERGSLGPIISISVSDCRIHVYTKSVKITICGSVIGTLVTLYRFSIWCSVFMTKKTFDCERKTFSCSWKIIKIISGSTRLFFLSDSLPESFSDKLCGKDNTKVLIPLNKSAGRCTRIAQAFAKH